MFLFGDTQLSGCVDNSITITNTEVYRIVNLLIGAYQTLFIEMQIDVLGLILGYVQSVVISL